jgi:hypothetical protein
LPRVASCGSLGGEYENASFQGRLDAEDGTVPRSQNTPSACGICVAASERRTTREAVAELKDRLGGADFQHIIAFFAIEHDAEVLLAAMAEAFPDVPVSGCSTAGEIGPSGMTQGGILLIAFPHAGFRVHGELIADIGTHGVERATEVTRRL